MNENYIVFKMGRLSRISDELRDTITAIQYDITMYYDNVDIGKINEIDKSISRVKELSVEFYEELVDIRNELRNKKDINVKSA